MTSGFQPTTSDEINLMDVCHFFHRQRNLLASLFVAFFGLTAIYVFFQPTLYQTKGSVLIGERFFFVQPAQLQVQNLIEPPDQIKYRLSAQATITPIKNTRIIEITSKRDSAQAAQEDVSQGIHAILTAHADAIQNKRIEFLKFLAATKAPSKDLVDLIDIATASTSSKQISDTQTVVMPYSGLLAKGLGIGLLASLFFALTLSIVVDQIQRMLAS